VYLNDPSAMNTRRRCVSEMSHVSRASSGIGMSEGSSIHTLAGFGTRRCEGSE
jgi:hypothetical protein